MEVRHESIRASITIGDLLIKTPYVKSFNVSKTRNGKYAASFTATFDIDGTQQPVIGESVIIKTSVDGVERKIFTGGIKKVSVQPSFDKAGWFSITVSGDDSMAKLDGKYFSRRLQLDNQPEIVYISSRTSQPYKAQKRNETHYVHKANSHEDFTKLIKAPEVGNNVYNGFAKPPKVRPFRKGAMTIHDHSSNDQWGPAFGTYSSNDE